MRITLVYPGRAYLPEIEAYRRHFEGRYEFRVVEKAALRETDVEGDVLWLVMGFYPGRLRAAKVIHDYRSLSVGRLPALKDRVKRLLAPRPDLRIFQNEAVEAAMGFRDGVPRAVLGMGVHADLVTEERLAREAEFDFCAVGDVTETRGARLWLRSFVGACPGKTLALAGQADETIRREFESVPGISFLGRVPLEEAYETIARSRTGISFVPDRRPYSVQAATKLMEYAAFRRRIVASDTPSNRETASRHGIAALFVPGFRFPRPEEVETAPSNDDFDAEAVSWERAIALSGIDGMI